MSDTKFEIICRAESAILAEVVMPAGTLTAGEVLKGITITDRRRLPQAQLIRDGVHLRCGVCHEPTYIRAGDEELFAFVPGSVRIDQVGA